jgi:KaiC/GvpD/RAD55 family RecA-like ATPase
MYDCLNDWNKHLATFCEPATTRVRDPSDTSELRSRVEDALEQRDMQDQGILVVDSLNEFGSLMQPMQAYRFVKDLRATVAKSRFVPVYASATVTDDGSGFPHDLDYMVDGIVELHLDDELVEGSLMKQVRVRKMSGVLNLPQWALYEYTAGEGIVTIDPRKGPTDGDGEETSATDTAVDPNGDGVAGEPEPGDTADHPGNTDPTSGSADESAGPASEADDAESDEA